MSKQLEVLNQY